MYQLYLPKNQEKGEFLQLPDEDGDRTGSFGKTLRILLACFFFFYITSYPVQGSERIAELGVFTGTSFYMGDLNQSSLFYSPSLAYGLFYKLNLNVRYAVASGFNISKLRGSGQLDNIPATSPSDFSTQMADFFLRFEINFLPYNPNSPKDNFTPFVHGGMAYSKIISSTQNAQNHLSIPFGFGFKYNLNDDVDFGVEWSLRKTFNDAIDGDGGNLPSNFSNFGNENFSYFLHNNDWYSFVGLFITFKFINFAEKCPAYY